MDVFFNTLLLLVLEAVPKPIPINTSNSGPAGGRMSAVKMGFRKSKELIFMTVYMGLKVYEELERST